MTRGPTVRKAGPIVVAVLLALAGALSGPAARPVAAASDALSLSTSTTYTLQPARHQVHVVLDIMATNDKPDTTSGGIVTRYFYEGARLAIQAEARGVRATTGTSRLTATVTPADGYAVLEVRFASGIFYHQTTKVRITFDLPGGAPRSNSDIRVGSAFATFVAWAFGDSGAVRIVVPAGFDAETTGSPLTRSTTAGSTVFSAPAISDVGAWYAVVNADRKAGLTTDRVDLAGGEHVVIRAWPEDGEWRKRVTALLAAGLPELATLIGLAWPVSADLQVFEVHTPLLEGYAGVFLESQDKIEISEDLDDLTILHEASHAWFNSGLFDGRWMAEGFADTYAARALDVVGSGSWTPDAVSPTDAAAVPLADWTHPGRIADKVTNAREQYGYEASWTVIRSLLAEIGIGRMQAVLRADADRRIAYVGAVPPEAAAGPTDWRRFLDLLQQAGGSTSAPDLFRRWVVAPADDAVLDERAVARTAYQGLVDAGGGWLPPAFVRLPMSTWDFVEAERRIPTATAVLATRDEIAGLIAPLRIDAPAALRTAYESAAASLDAARAVADTELAAAAALVAADAAVAEPRDGLQALGLLGQTPDAALAAAESAFTSGAADAAARADAVTALIGGAVTVGQTRLAIAFTVVVLLFVAMLLILMIARRRGRRGRRAARLARTSGPLTGGFDAGSSAEPSDSYATLPDQSGPAPDPSAEPASGRDRVEPSDPPAELEPPS
jgi:hypothetical protein